MLPSNWWRYSNLNSVSQFGAHAHMHKAVQLVGGHHLWVAFRVSLKQGQSQDNKIPAMGGCISGEIDVDFSGPGKSFTP